jgi:hypothetical protein
VKFSERIWTPYIEFGYQRSNFFDWLLAISWFDVAKADRNTHLVDDVTVGNNRINDTFPFASNNLGDWPDAVTRSNDQVTDPDTDFFIFPAAGGLRVFDLAPIVLVPPPVVTETLYNRIDLTMIEFKGGGRSWYPVYNWGKLGFASGPLFALIPYTLVTTQTIIAEPAIDPDDPVLFQAAHKQVDTWWDLGWFGAADMELRYGPVYGKGSIGYDIYFRNLTYTGVADVETRFNPSGWSLALTGGLHF